MCEESCLPRNASLKANSWPLSPVCRWSKERKKKKDCDMEKVDFMVYDKMFT